MNTEDLNWESAWLMAAAFGYVLLFGSWCTYKIIQRRKNR